MIRTRLAAGNPPDVAIIPRPGVVAELARDDALIPLEDMGLDPDTINENYSDTWTSLATVDDTVYGVVAKANSKSTIWYKPNNFEKNGFEVPTTWDALLALTQQYETKDPDPWAVGAQGRDNSWTLTDWFENIYARSAGSDNYTKLFNGDLPFNDQTVKDALTEMVKIVNDKYVAGGIDTALGISFVDGIGRVFSKKPVANMYMEGGFVGGIALGDVNPDLKPGEDIDFFPWPTIDEANGNPLVGGGDVASAFVNNEDNKKLIEFLSTPEAGTDLGLDGRDRLAEQGRRRRRVPERARGEGGRAAEERRVVPVRRLRPPARNARSGLRDAAPEDHQDAGEHGLTPRRLPGGCRERLRRQVASK